MKKIFLLTFLILNLSLLSQAFKQINKITAPFRGETDQFAWSVDIDGDYAIVGAPQEDQNTDETDTLNAAGSAFIYKRNGDEWIFHQKLTASDREPFDKFGYSVAIHNNTAIISAYQKDVNPGFNQITYVGAVYVFENQNGTWIETQKLVPENHFPYDQLGSSLDLNDSLIVLGASIHSLDNNYENKLNQSGAVYLFTKQNDTWIETQKLTAKDRHANAYFGRPVKIIGSNIVIGSRKNNLDTSGNNEILEAGAAYVFNYENGLWKESQKLVAENRHYKSFFGSSISGNDTTLFIGAPQESYNANEEDSISFAGAVYVYLLKDDNLWQQSKKLTATERDGGDLFGHDIEIKNNLLAISARYEKTIIGSDTLSTGGVFLYEKNDLNEWSEIEKLISNDIDQSDAFGFSFALSNDNIIVGAYNEKEDIEGNNTLNMSGSAYIFKPCRSFSTIDTSSCFSYELPSQTIVYETGVYTDTLSNSQGCDSIIFTKVIINSVDTLVNKLKNQTLLANAENASYQWLDCNQNMSPINGETEAKFSSRNSGNYAVQINQNGCIDTSACYETCWFFVPGDTLVCESYSFPSGQTYYTSGYYEDTLSTNPLDCDTIWMMKLTVNETDTAIYLEDEFTISAKAIDVDYQWLDCNLNMQQINGETEKTFTTTKNGSYAVALTKNGCTDTSKCIEIKTVGLLDINYVDNLISIYPNPTQDHVYLDLGNTKGLSKITIQSNDGKTLETIDISSLQKMKINLPNRPGVYFISIHNTSLAVKRIKVIKQ